MSDLVTRLREYAVAVGAAPSVLGLREILGEAATEIERLRSLAGAVSDGSSYQQIAKDARHEVPIGETPNNG